jgi:hypothetical protein
MFQDLYKLILSKGFEYVQNPEHRAQIIKVTFVVMMKLFTIVRNRMRKNNISDEHIECNCNSCKVWKAKLDDALKRDDISEKSEKKSFLKKRPILSFLLPSFLQTTLS